MKRKMFVLAVVALLGLHLHADTLSDWLASIRAEDRSLPTDISVGEETIRWYDDGTFVYYGGSNREYPYHPSSFTFPDSGVVATRMGSYCRLELNNYDGEEIEANGCLAIYAEGNNRISGRGILSDGGVFIGGRGSLTIQSEGDGVFARTGSIAVAPGVLLMMTVDDKGLNSFSGDLIMRGCMATIVAQRGDVLCASRDISISDSLICGYSREEGGINAGRNISVLRSALDIFSGSSCIYAGNVMNMSQSYFALADACEVIPEWRGYPGITGRETYLDQCYGKVYSRCSALNAVELLSIGKGKYYIGSRAGGGRDRYGDEYYAACVSRDTVIIDGGEVQICAPNGTAVFAEDHFDMKSGSLEIVDSFDVSKGMIADAAMASACTGVAFADGWHATMEHFYSQILTGAIQNALMSEIFGQAFCGVAMWYGTEYEHRAGTLVCDKAQYGFVTDKFTLAGGVFKGDAYTMEFEKIELGTGTGGTGSGTGTGTGTGGGGGDTGGEGPTTPVARENLKLVSFMPAIMRADGYAVNREVFAVDEDVYYLVQILAYRNGMLSLAPSGVRYTMRVSNGFEETRTFGGQATTFDGHSATMLIGRLPVGKYTMTCSIDSNGVLVDSDPTDNVRTAAFEVIADRGWNFVFDEALSVKGDAGQPVMATVSFHNETGHATADPVECLFSVRANGSEIGSFVKSYAVGADGKVKDTVDLAEHMKLPMGNYELTCRLDSGSAYAETREDDNEQMIAFRVTYPKFSVHGYFDTSVARSYQGVLLQDGITVLGTVSVQTSGWNSGNRMVVVTGTVTDETGKKHAIKGATTIGFAIPPTLECKVDVKEYGMFNLVFGYYGSGSNQTAAFTGDNGAGLSMCSLIDGIELGLSDASPFAVAAVVYDGMLQRDGQLIGTIQVKVAKGNKDKSGVFSAKVTATVQMAGQAKKLSFKNGIADATGKVTDMTDKDGNKLAVTVGVSGLGGEFRRSRSDTPYRIDGARNVFSGKSAADKDAAGDAVRLYKGVYNVAFDGGTLSVSVDKKGKAKIAGTVEGNKVSATSQLVVGKDAAVVPVVIVKKVNVAFCLWVMADGTVEARGIEGAIAGKAGTLKAGAKFVLDVAAAKGLAALPGLYGEYLPNGIDVAASGTKWIVAGGVKAGKVAFVKGGNTIDESKLGKNPSGLKLTYKQKDGTFKGSFKAYNLESSGKIKAYTANVTGVMIGAKGYGTATVKKPACTFLITIE